MHTFFQTQQKRIRLASRSNAHDWSIGASFERYTTAPGYNSRQCKKAHRIVIKKM